MLSEADAHVKLLKLIDAAKSFDELAVFIREGYAARGGATFGAALRFIAESDPSGLDAEVQERFAEALSRMVESPDALRLAGVLES